MPATVEAIISEALTLLDSDAGLIAGLNFANRRYRELASRVRFRHLRRRGEFIIPARVVTGEATFTQDSQLVYGDSDARAAWAAIGQEGLQGRWISPAQQPVMIWAEVVGLDGDGNLILSQAWPSETITAAGYALVSRFHRLPLDAQWLNTFTIPRLNYRLKQASQEELDWRSAGHFIQQGYPEFISLATPDPETGGPRVEIYPAGTQAEVVQFTYYAKAPALQLSQPLPHGLSESALSEGILIDLMRRKWATAIAAKDYEGAGHWRNEFNSQRTKWDRDYVVMAGDVDLPWDDQSVELRLGEEFMLDRQYDQLALGQWPAFF